MLHAMIDIETLATLPNAQIVEIGGVKFDPFSDAEPSSPIYLKPSLHEQEIAGRIYCEKTMNWWQEKNPAIIAEIVAENDFSSVYDVLAKLTDWSDDVDVFWGHGCGFDYTILDNFYRGAGRTPPWQYWQIRDSRTLFSCCQRDPRDPLRGQTRHRACDDAMIQAKAVQLAYQELSIKEFTTKEQIK